jgi:hypothetical protein
MPPIDWGAITIGILNKEPSPPWTGSEWASLTDATQSAQS